MHSAPTPAPGRSVGGRWTGRQQGKDVCLEGLVATQHTILVLLCTHARIRAMHATLSRSSQRQPPSTAPGRTMVKRGYRLGSSRLRLGRGTHCTEAGRQAALLGQAVGWVEPPARRQPSASMGMCNCLLLVPHCPSPHLEGWHDLQVEPGGHVLAQGLRGGPRPTVDHNLRIGSKDRKAQRQGGWCVEMGTCKAQPLARHGNGCV